MAGFNGQALIQATDRGLYCAAGDFYIDPWSSSAEGVDRAVITHAHADHLRPGHRRYLCSRSGEAVLRQRVQPEASVQTAGWGETLDINGVKVSLHPAGHLLGSAQVRVEHRGEVWVPFTVDCVLVYAQLGNGRRANVFTDYTFAVWDPEPVTGELVPVAKAYSGLTDAEIDEVDRFVRRNTLDKHGPVRVVKPELVFEIHFEGIRESTRHRSGVALRFPRMGRWRTDKKPADADTLEHLKRLLKAQRQPVTGGRAGASGSGISGGGGRKR